MKRIYLLLLLTGPVVASAQIVSGIEGGSGSTVGPNGDLYVTESAVGRISRIDLNTMAVTPYAEGLPTSFLHQFIGFGGAVDVAFIGSTAYVLVTGVGFPFDANIDGIYRIDGPNSFTPVADIGAFSSTHLPSSFPIELPNGLQYAMQVYAGGFLVTDGHHNRVLRVTLDGEVSEALAFDHDVVPTGLDVAGNRVHLAEAGPVPHLPENGKIVVFTPSANGVIDLAAGAPLLVDVEFGRGRTLFGLSQGTFMAGLPPAQPAMENTGALLRVTGDGGFEDVITGINRPTSLEIIGNDAYVVTLNGDIFRFSDIASEPFGH